MATATPKVFTISSATNAFLETQSGQFSSEADAVAAAKTAIKSNPNNGDVYVNQRLRAFRATVEIGEVDISQDAPVEESPQA